MNRYQKAYDSYDQTNQLIKITNSFYHFRNLELIKKRKPQFSMPHSIVPRKREIEPFSDFFVIKENDNLGNRLEQISNRPNKYLVKDIYNKGGNWKGFKEAEERERYLANEHIHFMVSNVKPQIACHNRDYVLNRNKMMTKLSKFGGKSIVLPRIKDSKHNPITEKTKKYYRLIANKNKKNKEKSEENEENCKDNVDNTKENNNEEEYNKNENNDDDNYKKTKDINDYNNNNNYEKRVSKTIEV